MGEHRIGIIINGATGRIGSTQHVANLQAIANDGGLAPRQWGPAASGPAARRP